MQRSRRTIPGYIKFLMTFLIWLTSVAGLYGCDLYIPGISPTATPTASLTPTLTEVPSPTASYTSTSTLSPTPTETLTPTATNTPLIFAETGTPLPEFLAPINAASAMHVSAFALWNLPDVTDLAWTPDGRSLMAATPVEIALFDPRLRTKQTSLVPEFAGVRTIAISPNNAWLVSGAVTGDLVYGYSTTLERWHGPDWQPTGLLSRVPYGLSDIVFSSNSRILFSAYSSPIESENFIDFWDTLRWEISSTLKAGTVLDLSVSSQQVLLATSPERYSVSIWDLANTTQPIYRFFVSFTEGVTNTAFSPDGLSIASGHYDGYLRLWDLATGMKLVEIDTGAVVESLAFSPDGTLLATGGSYQDGDIRLWQVDTGGLLRSLEGHPNAVSQLAFSPFGTMLASASYDGSIRLWGIRP